MEDAGPKPRTWTDKVHFRSEFLRLKSAAIKNTVIERDGIRCLVLGYEQHDAKYTGEFWLFTFQEVNEYA